MPVLKKYQDMTVEVLQQTENPAAQVGIALAITMRSDAEFVPTPVSEKTCEFLIDAEHHSVFEHCGMTILIQNVSRSFLAQITRQRMFKFTSGSQHYQDYRDYPLMVNENMMVEGANQALADSISAYTEAVDDGVLPQEARQMLPNACAVNLMVTMDARNMMYFLKQRLCNRNVDEMRIFASRLLSLGTDWFPQLFNAVGPQCYMDKCWQGKMQCEAKTWVPKV